MKHEDDVLGRVGHTEESFQALMMRQTLRGMRRKYAVEVPFSVYRALQEIMFQVKDGILTKEQGDAEFDQRVRPHIGKMPAGYNKERGDVVEIDYKRTKLRVVQPY